MTSEAGFFLYTLTMALVCTSIYLCFRGIAWVVANGWRSMLGLVALRGEAVVSFDDHADEAMLLAHEADTELSEANEAYVDDFLAWESELRERAS